MSAASLRPTRSAGWVTLAIVAVLVVVPLLAARLAGEEFTCRDGIAPLAILLFAETGVVLLAAIAAGPLGERLGERAQGLLRDRWNIAGAMVLMSLPFMIAAFTETSVCSRGRAYFWESILIEAFVLGIMAISYNLLFGFTGVISFGHAAFFGVGAYGAGILTLHYGLPWWLAIVVTLLLGVVIALIMGFVGLRLKGLYFAMFTLAFAEVLFLLSANRVMVDLTGAEDGLTFDVPDVLNTTQNRLFFYYLTLFLLIACFMLVRRLMQSPTGRVLSAIRDNEGRAQMLGYNTFHFKLIAIVISGVMATMAGLLYGISIKGANPGVLGVGTTVDALLQTIIGGLATFTGPLVGAFGLHLLRHVLRNMVVTIGGTEINIGQNWALILGIIFVLAVLAFPQGLVGTWQARRLSTLDGWLRWLGMRKEA